MKILHVVTSLERAGQEKLIYLLCRHNARDKENRLMVVVINDIVDKEFVRGIRQTRTRLVELKRKPGNPLSVIKYMYKVRKVLLQFQPEIVHVHNKLGFLIGYAATRFTGARLIYTLHTLKFFTMNFFDRLSKWFSIRGTDRFIAISESVKKDFLTRDLDPDAVVVVPNCIDLGEFTISEGNASVPIIVCVARLDHTIKGQDILLNALSLLKKRSVAFRCQMVGEGPSRPFLHRMANDLGLTEEVSFTGLRNDVPAILSKADLFVLPSRHEGFGIAILEAMASGLPVIVSDIDGPAEVVANGRDGLHFSSGDAQDLADKMENVLVDKDLRNRFAEASIRRVRTYSIDVMYDAYMQVYKKILDRQYGRNTVHAA